VIVLAKVDGVQVMWQLCEKRPEDTASVLRGDPSDRVKGWARQVVHTIAPGGTIVTPDGCRFVADHGRQCLRMVRKGHAAHMFDVVFRSIDWTIIDETPSATN
jgi:hypothetical protein